MERRPTKNGYTANSIGRRINEELNDIECCIFVVACTMKRRHPNMISRTGSIRKIFEETSNYSLGNSFIEACLTEEIVILHMIIGRQSMTLNYCTNAVF